MDNNDEKKDIDNEDSKKHTNAESNQSKNDTNNVNGTVIIKEKINLDKSRIIANVITGSLIAIITGIVLISIIVIINPFEQTSTSNVKNSKEYTTQMQRIADAFKDVSSSYIDDVDMEKLANGAIEGIAATTGDPYTRYIDADEYKQMQTEGTEQYGGIGVHVTFDENTNGILVLSVMPNSPAYENGVLSGDIITKVGDTTVTKDNYQDCVNAMKGDEGTQVNITIKREGQESDVLKTLTRKKIVANNVESKVLDNNVGYIRILEFENNVASQFKEQYDALRAKNVSGLIIDLRDNPGGLVNETVDIANSILPKGEIVKLVDKNGKEKIYSSDGKSEINIPLVVLVNSRSASASEILSSAIKDSKKGVLVGNKTYGKGIVQTIMPLDNDGALSVTTAKYYTASGVEIHKKGIEPNYTVDLPDDVKNSLYIPYDKDTQLQKAVELINSQIKK